MKRILLCILVAALLLTTSSYGEEQAAAASAPALAARLSELEALVDLVLADAADLPRAEFDPAALAAQLGNDPQVLFEWVRDRTWWAPYRGLLRGAKGVLLDRVGSNADRAVLLGDLLRRTGHTVRMAHAELPEQIARELLTKVRPIPGARRDAVARKADSPERDRATAAIVPGFEESLQQSIAESARLADEAGALMRSQADQLYALVKDSAVEGGAAEERTAIAALRDHWWVERLSDDQWIAMDVLLPQGEPGATLVAASDHSEWKQADELPAIPEEAWHTVLVRVVVERYENGETTESTPFETPLRPALVFDRPVTLRHLPTPWPDDLPDSQTDPNAVGNAAVNVKVWVPFLQVGDELMAQSGISDGGDLVATPFGAVNALSETGGGLFGGLDAALAGGEAATSYMTAQWIDYEIRVPGQPVRNLRRPVFDLLGPVQRAERAAGFDGSTNELLVRRYEALLSSTDILLQPCEFTDEFVAHLQTAGIVANEDALRELARQRDPSRVKSLAKDILNRVDDWGPLPSLVLWRSALGNTPAAGFIDRPNVLNYRLTEPVVEGGGMALRELIDIASNPTGVALGAQQNPFEVRLRQGVADTVAEMVVLDTNLGNSENTTSIFAIAGFEPDNSVLVRPGKADQVQTFGWPTDTAARLAQSVDGGFMAVAPREPVTLGARQRLGWWRVDPASGETIGVMDTGLHAAMTDKAELEKTLAKIREWLKSEARKEARKAMTAAQRAFDDAVALRLARVYRQIEELIALMP